MPKQMLELAGRPILAHTLDRFLEFHPDLVVMTVLHPSLLPGWESFRNAHFDSSLHLRMRACAGGAERTESVHAGLLALKAWTGQQASLVAIHDAVRPFIEVQMLEVGFRMAEKEGNAVAGVPVKSSLRMKTDAGSQAVDRSLFYHVQTPQIFRLSEILDCYEHRPLGNFTDDASLGESLGMKIHLFEGHYDNIKITTLEDLLIAEQMMSRKAKS